MIWQTSRFRDRPDAAAGDGHRQRRRPIRSPTADARARRSRASRAASSCVGEGADILDIGGESTRPGARLPDAAEQLARVLPVLAAARHASGVPVSVDTANPAVMRAALELGVDILNDVRALQAPGALSRRRRARRASASA